MGELWAHGRGNEAQEEQNLLGLEELLQGYGKKSEFQHFTILEEF